MEGARRSAHVLWIVLVALAVARLALAFWPTMWFWGINGLRFHEPISGWIGWAVMAVVLIPQVARRVMPLTSVVGDWLTDGRGARLMVPAVAGGLLVYLLPNQVRYVGDFLLRQGTVEQIGLPSTIYPQAFPLDVFLHYTLPLRLGAVALFDANSAARLIGMVEGAALAALAVVFARVLALRGGAALAAAAIVYFGGYLGMLTGYSKAFADLIVVVAAVGTLCLLAVRRGTGLLPLGIVMAVALTLHRSALGLLPAVLFAWVMWVRDRGWGELRRPAAAAGVLIPVLTLAVIIPRVVSTVTDFDARHFAPAEVRAHGGVLLAALAGTRPADMLSLLLLLSPVALAAPFMIAALGRSIPRARELVLLVLLAVPLVSFWPFLHPAHGMFRDWDDFSFTAVALSLVAAWLVGETLRAADGGAGRDARRARAPARGPGSSFAWVAVPVIFATAIPAIQWMALHADLERGLVRVRAFVSESPERSPAHRGHTWDFLGIRNWRLDRYDAAATAFAKAAETAPSPRILQEWALAETQRNNPRMAQRVYWRLLEKQPQNIMGWLGLASVSSRFGDINESRYAALELLQLQPDNSNARDILSYIDNLPPAMRDSLSRRYPPRDDLSRGWTGEAKR